jgi:uncharacterized membrane protein
MDLYSWMKFLHVAAAIAWLGGGITLFATALMAMRKGDTAMADAVVGQVAFLGTRWFIPASLATLVFGLLMAVMGNLWSEAWIVLGLAGFAATFLTGLLVLKPLSERIDALNREGRAAEAQALGRRILQVSKFDYTMLGVVVADMVFRPGWGDTLTLGLFAVVIVGAAVLFLRPGQRAAPTPTAA